MILLVLLRVSVTGIQNHMALGNVPRYRGKHNNLKNGNSPNDFLAFMGEEGSIQIKPTV